MNQPTDARLIVLKNFQAQLAALRDYEKTLATEPSAKRWIVMVEDIPLKFPHYARGKPAPTNLQNATRFTEQHARAAAGIVFNGNDMVGEAVPIRVAVTNSITELRTMITTLAAAA